MRKLLAVLAIVCAPVVSHAFSPVRYVQISTNTLTRQTGTEVIAGSNISTATISSATISNLSVGNINSSVTLSSVTVLGNLGVQGAINQPLTVTSSMTVNNNVGINGAINAPLTLTSSATVNNNFGVAGAINLPLTLTSSGTVNNNFAVKGAINQPLTVTSSMTVSNTLGATTFADATGRSIYGNFVASATATGVSSITVNVSGYTGYVVRVFLTNASGAKASGLLRVNSDATTNYSYSDQGWLLTVSSGASCGNTAANHILLTGVNSLGNGVNMTSTLNVDINSVSYYNGTTMYQESTGNNVANINVGAGANLTGITSISVWVGLINSCTSVTIPATGTTGRIWVWGVY